MTNFLKTVLNGNKREIKKYLKKVKLINNLEESMSNLSDEALKNKTLEFKERYTKGETLDKLLPEAFAVVREASKRVLGMRHYDVQLIGGMALHEGKIAEMRTGEGKTLVSTLPAYLNALTGKGVHIVTVNEYLAARDSQEMGALYTFLGLTVGLNISNLSSEEKKQAYEADITYGTNSEFGFDYLRDNMVVYKHQLAQKPLHYAIIDEVDSILIDEARTPLIISGQANQSVENYRVVAQFMHQLHLEEDYTIDEKIRSVMLTDSGAKKAERFFHLENLYDESNVMIHHYIQQGLKAKALMKRDVDYVVQNNEIMIVDEFTGRIMEGRRYSDGLHQSIEAKEGLTVKNDSMTLATVTLQNYFRMYPKLSGMTGTAATEQNEFWKIYQLDVVVIPTNKPVQRIDQSDKIYRTEKEKYHAIIEEIIQRNKKGQPVLVGTTSIENSEKLSDLLKKKGIKHTVLNAKHHEKEAEIVANAGCKHAVTIATNMAGRGTDIKLEEGIAELGGLHIIGTERHESRRIDNQLRGRAGRQGDPGSTEFIISVEDDIMRRFGSESLAKMMDRLGIEENEPIESRMITKAIQSAQKRVEGSNFDTRKNVLEYDDVINEQRRIIYAQRRQAIEQDGESLIVFRMMQTSVEKTVESYFNLIQTQEIDMEHFIALLEQRYLPKGNISAADLVDKDLKEMKAILKEKTTALYEQRKASVQKEIFEEFEKVILLRVVDEKWMEHIDAMDQLRQGIHLRAYAQTKPIQEFQFEGYRMFNDMIQSISDEVSMLVLKSQIVEQERVETTTIQTTSSSGEALPKKPAKSTKVGRNEPCPCGSGRKYKVCHGK